MDDALAYGSPEFYFISRVMTFNIPIKSNKHSYEANDSMPYYFAKEEIMVNDEVIMITTPTINIKGLGFINLTR